MNGVTPKIANERKIDGDVKVVTVEVQPMRWIRFKVLRYLGLNGYEKWPSLEEIIEVSSKAASKVIKQQEEAEAAWNKVYEMTFTLADLIGRSQLEVFEDFKKYFYPLQEQEKAAHKMGVVVEPATPAQNYTVDPFIGWTCYPAEVED